MMAIILNCNVLNNNTKSILGQERGSLVVMNSLHFTEQYSQFSCVVVTVLTGLFSLPAYSSTARSAALASFDLFQQKHSKNLHEQLQTADRPVSEHI